MLYVFHGSDVNKSLEKARSLANSLRTKKPDATYVEVIADNWSPSIIDENVGGQGLFSSKYIIFLNRVTENADAKDGLPDLIQIMNESTNAFILLEGKLNADLKKAVDKFAEKVVSTDEAVKSFGSRFSNNGEFNIFALADAVSSRNDLKSWTLYREAVDGGLEAENIIGVLFWKIKTMISTQKFGGTWSEIELNRFLTDLIKVYHDGHRGMVDSELAIERMMLSLKN